MTPARQFYYTREDVAILKFIIEKKAYYNVRGNFLWQVMEREKVVDRTWQSIRNRFTKHLTQNLLNGSYSKYIDEKLLNYVYIGFHQTRTDKFNEREVYGQVTIDLQALHDATIAKKEKEERRQARRELGDDVGDSEEENVETIDDKKVESQGKETIKRKLSEVGESFEIIDSDDED